MSTEKPIVLCPPDQRQRARRALFLRLHDAFELLCDCERSAREVEDYPLARSIANDVTCVATTLSDLEKTVRKELGW